MTTTTALDAAIAAAMEREQERQEAHRRAREAANRQRRAELRDTLQQRIEATFGEDLDTLIQPNYMANTVYATASFDYAGRVYRLTFSYDTGRYRWELTRQDDRFMSFFADGSPAENRDRLLLTLASLHASAAAALPAAAVDDELPF